MPKHNTLQNPLNQMLYKACSSPEKQQSHQFPTLVFRPFYIFRGMEIFCMHMHQSVLKYPTIVFYSSTLNEHPSDF